MGIVNADFSLCMPVEFNKVLKCITSVLNLVQKLNEVWVLLHLENFSKTQLYTHLSLLLPIHWHFCSVHPYITSMHMPHTLKPIYASYKGTMGTIRVLTSSVSYILVSYIVSYNTRYFGKKSRLITHWNRVLD